MRVRFLTELVDGAIGLHQDGGNAQIVVKRGEIHRQAGDALADGWTTGERGKLFVVDARDERDAVWKGVLAREVRLRRKKYGSDLARQFSYFPLMGDVELGQLSLKLEGQEVAMVALVRGEALEAHCLRDGLVHPLREGQAVDAPALRVDRSRFCDRDLHERMVRAAASPADGVGVDSLRHTLCYGPLLVVGREAQCTKRRGCVPVFDEKGDRAVELYLACRRARTEPGDAVAVEGERADASGDEHAGRRVVHASRLLDHLSGRRRNGNVEAQRRGRIHEEDGLTTANEDLGAEGGVVRGLVNRRMCIGEQLTLTGRPDGVHVNDTERSPVEVKCPSRLPDRYSFAQWLQLQAYIHLEEGARRGYLYHWTPSLSRKYVIAKDDHFLDERDCLNDLEVLRQAYLNLVEGQTVRSFVSRRGRSERFSNPVLVEEFMGQTPSIVAVSYVPRGTRRRGGGRTRVVMLERAAEERTVDGWRDVLSQIGNDPRRTGRVVVLDVPEAHPLARGKGGRAFCQAVAAANTLFERGELLYRFEPTARTLQITAAALQRDADYGIATTLV